MRRNGEHRICPVCSTQFWAQQNEIKSGRGKYCKKVCANIGRKGRPSPLKGTKVPFKPHPWKIGQVPKSAFKRGHIPWCAGKKMDKPSPSKGKKTGRVPPNAFKKGQSISPATQFAKGQKAWNEGIPSNPEHLKPFQKKKGEPSNQKGKKFPELSGQNHPNWQGGKTPEKIKIRTSADYKVWRRAVFERDSHTCLGCKTRGGDLHADHILPFEFFPEFRLDVNNGRTLCVPCHKKTPTYGFFTKEYRDAMTTFCMLDQPTST